MKTEATEEGAPSAHGPLGPCSRSALPDPRGKFRLIRETVLSPSAFPVYGNQFALRGQLHRQNLVAVLGVNSIVQNHMVGLGLGP